MKHLCCACTLIRQNGGASLFTWVKSSKNHVVIYSHQRFNIRKLQSIMMESMTTMSLFYSVLMRTNQIIQSSLIHNI